MLDTNTLTDGQLMTLCDDAPAKILQYGYDGAVDLMRRRREAGWSVIDGAFVPPIEREKGPDHAAS